MTTKPGRWTALAYGLCAATLAGAQQWPVGDPALYSPEPMPMWGWVSGWIVPLLLLLVVAAAGAGMFFLVHRASQHPHHWPRIHLNRGGAAIRRQDKR
ncbi:MAG TPA: hypothetical protein VMI74_16975 [Burkholderiales bacterium]|nr:hypothetical protein [Burkholderiales bacterium]